MNLKPLKTASWLFNVPVKALAGNFKAVLKPIGEEEYGRKVIEEFHKGVQEFGEHIENSSGE
ncbi:MAG: hypothetical protein HRT47_02240 [Candidatus Caenarcaniphilales bacterium]|nr:hypothetical protein [Candidatus Caenarcaniphilales bacterium]